MAKKKARILTKKDTYTESDYPALIKMAQDQCRVIWFDTETGVEADVDDVRGKLTPGERHGLITTLKLFTKYEVALGGEEFWGGKVNKMYPRPEVQRLSATFAFMELGVHAPFYNRINEALNIATEEFHNSWKEEEVLRERIEFIDHYAASKNPLEATAAFAFMEGAVLFSNFAYIKSLNSDGFSMCKHIVAGIDASAKDENYHSIAAGWLFRQALNESMELGLISDEDLKTLHNNIISIAETVFQHECSIIDLIFSQGNIRTIQKEDIIEFVKNRIDTVLDYLNMKPLYGTPPGKISKWFANSLSTYKYADFFSAQQIQYTRDWNKNKLIFRKDVLDQ